MLCTENSQEKKKQTNKLNKLDADENYCFGDFRVPYVTIIAIEKIFSFFMKIRYSASAQLSHSYM